MPHQLQSLGLVRVDSSLQVQRLCRICDPWTRDIGRIAWTRGQPTDWVILPGPASSHPVLNAFGFKNRTSIRTKNPEPGISISSWRSHPT